jgi:hypothetical protein
LGTGNSTLRPDVVTNRVVRLISRANLLLKRAKADVRNAPRPPHGPNGGMADNVDTVRIRHQTHGFGGWSWLGG